MSGRLFRDEKEIEKIILRSLESLGQISSFTELLQYLPPNTDRRIARRVFASLVKKGIIVRRPDYEKKRLVYCLS
ncbi:MAG: hypothetical protein GSR77_05500 [Desulfurococcales archaeon]|nr:hypothetical protein [Desulfurococcales archaeon]